MQLEIIGTDGTVHYTRPHDHPDVWEALNTPGYSVRGTGEKRASGSLQPAGCASLHCLCCYRPLKEAPTDLGWVKHSVNEGICFDCIESLHRTMVAHREAEARHNDSSSATAADNAGGAQDR